MPEGHTIHRLARDHVRDLAREPLQVSSPQGRAVETARALDGRSFAKIDAYGKHLLYRFEDDLTLHVHLGLFGRFRRQHTPPEEPKGEKRLRMVGERWTVDLSGAVACTLIDPDEEAALLSRRSASAASRSVRRSWTRRSWPASATSSARRRCT